MLCTRCVGRPLGRRRGSRLRARVGASAGPLAAADLLHHGINAVCAHTKERARDVSTAKSRRRRGRQTPARCRGAAHRHPPSPAAFAHERGEGCVSCGAGALLARSLAALRGSSACPQCTAVVRIAAAFGEACVHRGPHGLRRCAPLPASGCPGCGRRRTGSARGRAPGSSWCSRRRRSAARKPAAGASQIEGPIAACAAALWRGGARAFSNLVPGRTLKCTSVLSCKRQGDGASQRRASRRKLSGLALAPRRAQRLGARLVLHFDVDLLPNLLLLHLGVVRHGGGGCAARGSSAKARRHGCARREATHQYLSWRTTRGATLWRAAASAPRADEAARRAGVRRRLFPPPSACFGSSRTAAALPAPRAARAAACCAPESRACKRKRRRAGAKTVWRPGSRPSERRGVATPRSLPTSSNHGLRSPRRPRRALLRRPRRRSRGAPLRPRRPSRRRRRRRERQPRVRAQPGLQDVMAGPEGPRAPGEPRSQEEANPRAHPPLRPF